MTRMNYLEVPAVVTTKVGLRAIESASRSLGYIVLPRLVFAATEKDYAEFAGVLVALARKAQVERKATAILSLARTRKSPIKAICVQCWNGNTESHFNERILLAPVELSESRSGTACSTKLSRSLSNASRASARSMYANNPAIVQSQLGAHSFSTQDRVQQALDVGYEVTIHASPISQDGWAGAGFTLIDPATGAGGYLIEGGTNGGWLLVVLAIALLVIAAYFAVTLFLAGIIGGFALFLGIAGPLLSYYQLLKGLGEINSHAELNALTAFVSLKAFAAIILSTLTMAFYSVNITIGFLNQMQPFSIFNFAIFFMGGWFF